MKNQLIAHNGSVQRIPGIPDDIKELYKTAWEMKQKNMIDMAADRGAFIDQSQVRFSCLAIVVCSLSFVHGLVFLKI